LQSWKSALWELVLTTISWNVSMLAAVDGLRLQIQFLHLKMFAVVCFELDAITMSTKLEANVILIMLLGYFQHQFFFLEERLVR